MNLTRQDSFYPVELLAVLVHRSHQIASQLSLQAGYRENLDQITHRLQKIRSFQNSDARKRIGVFGPPKRGKSTLLNVLLGVDILPTSPIPMSSAVVELEQEERVSGWEVTIYHANNRIDCRQTDSEREVSRLIEHYASHRGVASAKRLRIKAAFSGCRILAHGGVLIDTPGAEVAFESDEGIKHDTQRALEILRSTHVVLFSVRADQIGSRSESCFYEEHMRRLAPLNIVSFKDKWASETDDLLDEAMNKYGFPERSTLLISAREAHSGRTSSENSDASGVGALEERIVTEIDRLTPEWGLYPCIDEYYLVIEQEPRLKPERIRIANLRDALASCDQSWSEQSLKKVEELERLR